jgi:cell division protein FtsB
VNYLPEVVTSGGILAAVAAVWRYLRSKELANEKSRLEADNSKLRKRVAELEAQVKVLESLLAKRSRNVKSSTTTRRKK